MPVNHRMLPDGILIVERSGTPTAADEDASIQARLLDDHVAPGIRVLVDSREVDLGDSTEVVRHLAGVARATAARAECGAVALVVGSEVSYGMARMYMALTELRHPNTEVFREYEQALAWLRSQPKVAAHPSK